MRRLFLITPFAVFAACTHQQATAPPKTSIVDQLMRTQEITLRVKNNKITLGGVLDNVEDSPLSRQIGAAFAYEPRRSNAQMFQHQDATAFQLPFAIAVGEERRAILQRDIDMILTLLLEQERRHAFHGNIALDTAARPLSVEIVDSDDAGIVRANCQTSQARVSTGFIRRLLERAVATASQDAGMMFGDKPPMWPTDSDGNWPPSLLLTISNWNELAETGGITLTKTVRRMFELENRLQMEVVPAIDAELAKLGEASLAQIVENDDELTPMAAAEQFAERVNLPEKPRQALNEILREANGIMERVEANEESREARELGLLMEEFEMLGDQYIDPVFDTFIFARFVQEQYLKALAFTVAHEAAHLWIDGCALPTRETENAADAFAVLVSFELFHNHQARVKFAGLGPLVLPEPKKDDTPFTDLIGEALGWSGFDLVAETFGQSGLSPDSSHDDFETRQAAVRDLYLQLVNTAVVPTTPQ